MMKTSVALSLVIASMVLPACGPKKKSKKNTTAPIVMFNHGDPKQLILGATQDRNSFLTKENFKTFDGFHFAGAAYFIEKEKQYNPKDFSEVEADNSTADEGDADPVLERYSFVEENGAYIFRPERSDSKLPSLSFKATNDILELVNVGGDAVAVEHYSLKRDGKAFSVLVSFTDDTAGRGLFSATFADSATVNRLAVAPEDKKYNYLNGHRPVKWEQDISLDLCGDVPQEQQDSVKASMEAWYADPTRQPDEEYRGVSYNVKTQYPPFSDLNTQCILLVNNYKAENSTNFFVGGATLTSINFANEQIIDGDIFIFMDHLAKEVKGQASPTTTHEIGHFLGLGHEFDDPDQGHEHYKSIMGYSDGTDNVTVDDFKAIRNLYKTSLGDQSKLTE
ncbi:MAG: hypothetical protein M3Q07_26170 [Pseudobdellovibrionaceae bacterium]|nr:hypothetical protein [Pseudobdellovibrionaceae bacterium]